MNTFKEVIKIIRSIRMSSKISPSRSFDDFFSDRLIQSFSRPTLLDSIEFLIKSVDAELENINKKKLISILNISKSPDAFSIMNWIRKHPRIVAMLSTATDDALDETLKGLDIDIIKNNENSIIERQPIYDIGIKVTCLSPLAHGADIKAGNATLFRRMSVITTNGAILELPFYSGNALRGQIRDILADHFISCLGFEPRRDKPPIRLWFFHVLYAGGILEEKTPKEMEPLFKEIGAHGAYRIEGIHKFRDMLPALSLLGAALGNKIISGRCQFGDLRPVCKQWGNGKCDINELMEWIFLTRHDDYEGRTEHDAHQGMIANTETLRAGTFLLGGIDIDSHANKMERSALGLGLKILIENGRLGAETRRGLGKVKIDIENLPDSSMYEEYLIENKEIIKEYLNKIGALNASN